jgi:hypothetical protein
VLELVNFKLAGAWCGSHGIQVKIRIAYTSDELVEAICSAAGKPRSLFPRPLHMVGTEFYLASMRK